MKVDMPLNKETKPNFKLILMEVNLAECRVDPVYYINTIVKLFLTFHHKLSFLHFDIPVERRKLLNNSFKKNQSPCVNNQISIMFFKGR